MVNTFQLPSRQTAFVALGPGDTLPIDGLSSSQSFDATSDFTVAFWIRFDDVSGYQVVANCPDNLLVSLQSGRLGVEMGDHRLPSFQVDRTLASGTWYHVAIAAGTHPEGVGEPDPGDGRLLSVFLDGLWAAYEEIPTGLQPEPRLGPLQIGDPVNTSGIDLWSLQVFPEGLDEAQVSSVKFNKPDHRPPVAGYDFSQVPPVPAAGSPALPAVTQEFATPGMKFDPTYAQRAVPDLSDGANPGGGGGAYTVQLWCYPLGFAGAGSHIQAIFQNGPNLDPALSVRLSQSASDLSLEITAWQGAEQYASVSGLTVDRWINVAVTYDPEIPSGQSNFLLYVNGEQVAEAIVDTPPSLASPQITVAAGTNGSLTFNGYVQTVAIWTRALSASEVKANLLPFDPIDDASCVSIYDFTQEPVTNLIEGTRLTLHGEPAVEELQLPVSAGDAAELYQVHEAPRQERLRSLRQIEAEELAKIVSPSGTGGLDRDEIDLASFSRERLEQLVEEIHRAIPRTWSARQRSDFKQAAREHVESVFERAASGELPLDGLITHEIVDDHYVFFHHHRDGITAVARASTAEIDDCTAWRIEVVATGLYGLLSILDVPVTPGIIAKIIRRLLGKSRLARAFAETLDGEITGRTIVAFVNVLYDQDYFWSFVDDVLDSLSWWDFAFFVAELGIELLALIAPAAEIAIIVAKLATTVTQLLVLEGRRPPNC